MIRDIIPVLEMTYEQAMEQALIAQKVGRPTIGRTIEVKEGLLEHEYEALRQEALDNVCECFRPYIINYSYTAPDPTIEELEAVIEDSYYFHREADEDWRDCRQWEIDREEALADSQIMEMRGK